MGTLFEVLLRTFEDLRFVGTYESSDGHEILHFRWRLGDQEVEGAAGKTVLVIQTEIPNAPAMDESRGRSRR